jgi:hypothetical protein
MNERIEKLVRQAGLTQAKDFKSGDEVKNFVFGNGLEKFAELIVRECAEIVKDSPWKLGNSYAASDQAWLIKEHFGVKE